jgi:hypothetical protein
MAQIARCFEQVIGYWKIRHYSMPGGAPFGHDGTAQLDASIMQGVI